METSIQYSGGILLRSGRYLFGKRSENRSSYPGVWDIFGGHIEAGESPDDALKREFGEELGIVPSTFQLFKTAILPPGEDAGAIRFYIYFITAWEGGEPQNCSDEHSTIQWFSRHELNGMNLASSEYLSVIGEWEKFIGNNKEDSNM